jgi:ribonucleoside-diphosphate reductase alpha chain
MSEELDRSTPGMLDLSISFPEERKLLSKKPVLSDNALTVLKKRYLIRDPHGNVTEKPEDMFARVAKAIAEVDLHYDPKANFAETAKCFYEMMVDRDFMPNSPTLMNAARNLGQLSACFVLPVEDSMEAIFQTLKNTALIHKSGGGTGFSFSRIRPANDVVKSTVGVSSGPISFMQVYDAATETVKQGGTRRGANMGILRVDHPDILEFIECKANLDKLNNFNISVALTEDFMKAVDADSEFELRNPRGSAPVAKLKAREVFEKIVHHAWSTGEPGIIFLDRVNRDNPTPHIGEIESTNPCGEQPLLPYESCNLGSINLSNFVLADKTLDFDRLSEVTQKAVHFLDNVIDANKYPLKEIEQMTRANRKIGLGIMGFADMLFQMGIPYNSEKAVCLAEEIMSSIQVEGRKKSVELAAKRGTFPNFRGSIFDHPDGIAVRNATVTTIAPTGTISIISSCSSGIEPIFALAYERNVMDGTRMLEVNPFFEKALRDRGIYSEELMRKVIEKGTVADIDEIPKDMRDVFVTSHDITPEWHVRIQAAFQKYTDNAVSKTVNFSNKATEEEVRKVYRLAYELGCKGVTIYRDGSRSEQVLSVKKSEPKEEKEILAERLPKTVRIKKRPRPVVTQGATYKIAGGCGKLYVTINEDEHSPCELFTHIGKSGGCAQSWSEAVSRMISLALRSGIDPQEIYSQLKGIACPSPVWDRGEMIKSCSDGISKALYWYIEARKNEEGKEESEMDTLALNPNRKKDVSFKLPPPDTDSENGEPGTICSECGSRMYYEEGCQKCYSCGNSKCG